ncbi:hypothetical protein DERP_009618 [Dermatophagoides pteronyssinus]|uniref:MRH domain-containing protein n=1 Tax=Dermatophagoides pteronyssinus TaxID=6956 RepID=A0ABQ8JB25_DERPT|nr:hypothetical protein DERP_009618 [Dermatophagoides pteronyssinus]
MIMWWLKFFIFICLWIMVSYGKETKVKIAHSSIDHFNGHLDFKHINENLLNQRHRSDMNASIRLQPRNFIGPEILNELLDECYLYEDSKYYYRVCMFRNITQHEKSKYYHSFHAILGIWKEWYVTSDHFDFLLYLEGDDCIAGSQRQVVLELECPLADESKDLAWISNVTEIHQCIYAITMKSQLFCGNLYSHLDQIGQIEWNLIKSLHSNNQLSQEEYTTYLQSILDNYGLKLLMNGQTFEDIVLVDRQKSREPNDHQKLLDEITSLKKKLEDCQNSLLNKRPIKN